MNTNEYIKTIKHGGFRSFIKRAAELGISISVMYDGDIRFTKLSYKGKTVFCYKNNLPIKRNMGNFTKRKTLTKAVLAEIGISTPRGITARSHTEAIREVRAAKLRYPLIAKPLDGSLAKGVTWNICSEKELRAATQHALIAYGKRKNISIIVEEMFVGNEYRVLVFGGKVISCVQKIPAGVTGDGKSPIKNLIKTFNKTRLKGFEIRLDATAKESLKKAGLTLDSILEQGRFFKFRNNLNMSDGGRAIDTTRDMHPSLKKAAVAAIEAVGLTYGGLDFLAEDISSEKAPYVILEINPHPFYNMNEKPLVEGKGVDVSLLLLESIFPALKKS